MRIVHIYMHVSIMDLDYRTGLVGHERNGTQECENTTDTTKIANQGVIR